MLAVLALPARAWAAQPVDAAPVTRAGPFGQPPPPADSPGLAAPRPQRQLRWNRLSGSTSGMLLALTTVYVGGEVSLLWSMGTPTPSASSAGAAEGWLLQAGVQGSLGLVSGSVCRGAGFCGTRAAGGLALKGGWGRGVASREGWASPSLMFYAQLDLLAGYFALPSAPLVAEVSSWEAIARLRLGAHVAALSRPSAASRVALNVALVLEGVPVTRAIRGVSVGFLVGIAF